jgi:hypothetical protein
MKKLTAFFASIRWIKLLTIGLVGSILLLTTACNNGDKLGARPDIPPVQMGGQNNPYKQDDGYTQYRMSTDPNVPKADPYADKS